MTRTRYLLPILVLAALVGPASAAQVTLTDTWQNLGTGPLLISVVGGDGMFEASATAPTDSGQAIFRNQNPFAFNATTSIWGRRRSPSYPTVATYSPVTVGGGTSTFTQTVPPASGTGGASALTLGTSPTTNAVPAASRKSLLITNQSATASVTFCFGGSGITPAANAAGLLHPFFKRRLPVVSCLGVRSADGFNAVASAANTPVTIEAH